MKISDAIYMIILCGCVAFTIYEIGVFVWKLIAMKGGIL